MFREVIPHFFCKDDGFDHLPHRLPTIHACFTLLRRKPRLRAEAHYGAQARVFRPWMNAGRVPFEAPKERSRVCFGGFRPTKDLEESRALARGAPHK